LNNKEKSNNNVYFENSELWNNYDVSGLLKEKVKLVLNYIPDDVSSIIDIGCGNGIITNQLAERYFVMGVDASKEALSFVKTKKLHSSSDKINVEDHSFDLVFSSELLEHLPENNLVETVNEFKRINKKYIFITVPNNEMLSKTFIKCDKCNNIFHAYGHINSFNEAKLIDLIGDDFIHLKTNYFGPQIKEYNKTLMNIRQKCAKRWYQADKYSICPICGNNEFYSRRGNLISKICNGLNLLISPKKHYWLFTIFERRNK